MTAVLNERPVSAPEPEEPIRSQTKPNDLWKVVLWTLLFIPIGLIDTVLRTNKAKRRGQPTTSYWKAFGITAAVSLTLFSWVLHAASSAISGATASQPSVTATAPVTTQQPAPIVKSAGYLGGMDLNAFCAANYPGTSANFTATGSWTCGTNSGEAGWNVAKQLSPADFTAACTQQYTGMKSVEAKLEGSAYDGWGCYGTKS